jgi:DMSO/TMAO reductase YedYZ molybdopterin-dependent catalytic subunit
MDAARRGGHPWSIEQHPEDLRPYGRRTFLAVVGAGLTSLLWGPKVWGFTRDALLPVSAVLPPPLRGLVRDGWRIYTVTSMPHFHPETWRLTVDGLVERPLEIDYHQLGSLPRSHETRDFHCVTGWSVKGVRWSGVRLTDLLEVARPRPEAQAIAFYSADLAYVDTLTLDQAQLADAMLADRMDGQPLTRPHGSPLRLVVPEMYGYKGVKWVHRIELVDAAFDGFWEERGYDRDAWIGRSNGL